MLNRELRVRVAPGLISNQTGVEIVGATLVVAPHGMCEWLGQNESVTELVRVSDSPRPLGGARWLLFFAKLHRACIRPSL